MGQGPSDFLKQFLNLKTKQKEDTERFVQNVIATLLSKVSADLPNLNPEKINSDQEIFKKLEISSREWKSFRDELVKISEEFYLDPDKLEDKLKEINPSLWNAWTDYCAKNSLDMA